MRHGRGMDTRVSDATQNKRSANHGPQYDRYTATTKAKKEAKTRGYRGKGTEGGPGSMNGGPPHDHTVTAQPQHSHSTITHPSGPFTRLPSSTSTPAERRDDAGDR